MPKLRSAQKPVDDCPTLEADRRTANESNRKRLPSVGSTRPCAGDCPTEEVEQTHLFRWTVVHAKAVPELLLLHAIPNGGLRSKSEAARMKAAGIKAGVPDLFLPVARNGCHGLYIELKRRVGGRVSAEQIEWMDVLQRQGYCCALAKGWEMAAGVLCDYLGLDKRRML